MSALLVDLLKRADYQGLICGRILAFDVKMLMDTCTELRHDHRLQQRVFSAATTDRRLKIEDRRVIRNFFLNLPISYNPSFQLERGIKDAPVVFLMPRSDTSGTHLANSSDLIYRRPDLFL